MDERQRKQYEILMDKLDRYIFIMELSGLIMSQGGAIYCTKCKNLDDFMGAIENVTNYLNTAYTIKEFASALSWDDDVNKIQNRYYKTDKWYKFTMDYRNCAVHSFALPRHFNPDDGELVINVDELIEKQNELLKTERKKKSINQIKNRIISLKDFKKFFTPVFPMSYFVKMSCKNILKMTVEMLTAEFENVTKEAMLELIEMEKKTDDLELALTIENFYVNSKNKLKNDESLFLQIQSLFVENDYTCFAHYDSTEWF